MIIKKYLPAFFSGFEDKYYEVFTKEELFDSELIKPLLNMPNFYRISYSQQLEDQLAIMVELNEGYEWWVVALIHDISDIKTLKEWLPQIEYKYKKKIKEE